MKQTLIIIGLFVSGLAFGQESKIDNFLTEIQKYDISDLLTLKKFQTEFEGDTTEIERMEPLGFIGDNYQRFYIHFISVIQNPNNTLEYFVYGKSRVKTNICSFQGIITIKNAKTYLESDLLPLRQGFVTGDYEFFEDSDQKGTGIFKGVFKTNYYIDTKGKIHYDALNFVADGYKNNQFQGTWTSYKSEDSKKCNWGDYRIPDSQGLDIGAGEFSVNEKYVSNGWLTYMTANGIGTDMNGEMKKAENEKWWIEK
ncbi:MAG TPA: hypothetical protein PKG96_09670 [Bacilli bacterium]|jgi:hypothetical protein|nr:hypothetical protein [Bacilli bacterium]